MPVFFCANVQKWVINLENTVILSEYVGKDSKIIFEVYENVGSVCKTTQK